MPQQILEIPSCRFFPHWKNNCTDQLIGLMEMVNHIIRNNPLCYHWIEIGSYIGESSSIFLGFDMIKKLECIEANTNYANILKIKYEQYIQTGRCLIHNTKSISFAPLIYDQSVDVVYIDADHSYESVKEELDLYFPKIRYGGFICGHDYNKFAWPGVCSAVDEFRSTNKVGSLFKFRDCSWLLQKLI